MTKARWFAILLLVVFFLPVDGGGVIPPVTPPPISEAGLRVVIWEETEDRQALPREQQDILQDQAWKTWVETHGGQWRQLDPTTEPLNDQPWVRGAWKRTRSSLPWYQAGNGTTGSEGPLPASVAEWDNVLEPLGVK